MPDTFAIASQNGLPINRIVQAQFGREKRGFMLQREGPSSAINYFGLYTDGTQEDINPPFGYPRPDPDPAIHSKGVILPTSLQGNVPESRVLGSFYTGLMRRVVQCQLSKGQEPQFDYQFGRTHGILEYPYTRQVGSNAGAEADAYKKRRFWLIEISSLGIYAAPITFGLQCLDCVKDIADYMPTEEQLAENPQWAQYRTKVSLNWAFVNRNESNRVMSVISKKDLEPVYQKGATWYEGMGWAFSYSGQKISNVLRKQIGDGIDFSPTHDFYETTLVSFTLAVQLQGTSASIVLAQAGVALVTLAGHTFENGDLVQISGCQQEQYNGTFVVHTVLPGSFRYNVTGSPASPATGNPTVANTKAPATITGTIAIGQTGKVTFKRSSFGTLWVPSETQSNLWNGIFPWPGNQEFIPCDSPVHVFYDGEEQVLTSWKNTKENIPQDTASVPSGPWDGNATGVHAAITTTEQIPICQSASCFAESTPISGMGSGHHYPSYTKEQWGFYGAVDLVVDSYSRFRGDSATAVLSGEYVNGTGIYGHSYDYCPDCYYVNPSTGKLVTGGIGSFAFRYYDQDFLKTTVEKQETKSGGSVLILFPTEREVVAGFKTSVTNELTTTKYAATSFRVATEIYRYSPGSDPRYTEYKAYGIGWKGGLQSHLSGSVVPPNVFNVPSSVSFADFSLLGTGGFSYGLSYSGIGQSPDLFPFSIWTKGQKETAESGINFMRGALFHIDPALSPPSQLHNRWYKVDGDSVLMSGFPDHSGKTIVGFVGQV